MKKLIFAFAIISIFISPCFGQTQQLKKISKQQINQLNKGVLLVRLKAKKKTILKLRKSGKDNLANKIEQQQAELNKKIVSAFRDNFEFCSTYFFFSEHSKSIKDKQFSNVIFLNDNLVPDSIIKFDYNANFFIAEFVTLEQNDHANMGFEALVIRNDQFVQLKRPFPYYARTFGSLPIKQKLEKAVRRMNKKLYKFLKK
jgi:hypothetical protein